MNCCNDYGRCTQAAADQQPIACAARANNPPAAFWAAGDHDPAEDADRASWYRLLRETVILLAGIVIGALVCAAAIAASVRMGG